MFDKWLKLPAHYYLRITALVILTVGICLHNTLMSIGAIWIMANWLIEADFKHYWKKFKSTPTVWMLLVILFFGLLSLLWSDDVAYGLKDLGRKMPFFAIPFALALGKPVEEKVQVFLLYVFIGILVLTSGINYYRFNYVVDDSIDGRNMSYFISHVRFSVLTVLGIFTALFLIFKKKGPKLLWMAVALWLLFYTFKSQTLNGYLLLGVLTVFTLVYLVLKLKSRKLKMAIAGIALLGLIGGAWGINKLIHNYHQTTSDNLEALELYTVNGRVYLHDLNSNQKENGNYVWMYVQQEELENEWNKRSVIAYDSLDRLNQPMFGTLLRYMTSLNLKKDSVGIWSLTDEDIVAIENGTTTVKTNHGLVDKLYAFIYQWELYKEGADPNGHSLLQRVEHQSVAWSIVMRNGLLGVGMGDVPAAFDQAYIDTSSRLSEENQLRSHNQYLTIWISHGILGVLMLLGMLIYPLFKRNKIDYFHLLVFFSLFFACLFQDMIETQAGVTIFGLFYGITVYKEDESLSSDMSTSEESE